jgi:quinoprotein glucose dehydrogenase
MSLFGGLVAAGVLVSVFVVGASVQSTVRDGVYTKAQAERGKATFGQYCTPCHALDSKTAGLDGPPLGGEVFFTNWTDQSLYTLVTQIMLSMPPDGSVALEPADTADLIAYILESNKLPAGETELKADASARDIKIVPPGSGGGSRR